MVKRSRNNNIVMHSSRFLNEFLIRDEDDLINEFNGDSRLLADDGDGLPTSAPTDVLPGPDVTTTITGGNNEIPAQQATITPTVSPARPSSYREDVAQPFGWLFMGILGLVVVVVTWRLCVCWSRLRERRHLMLQSAAADNVLGDMNMVSTTDDDFDDLQHHEEDQDEDDELI